jgi:hypothetical protein
MSDINKLKIIYFIILIIFIKKLFFKNSFLGRI